MSRSLKAKGGAKPGGYVWWIPDVPGEMDRTRYDAAVARIALETGKPEGDPEVQARAEAEVRPFAMQLKVLTAREFDRLGVSGAQRELAVRASKGDADAVLSAKQAIFEECVGEVREYSDVAGEPITDGQGIYERGDKLVHGMIYDAIMDHATLSAGARELSPSPRG